MNELDERCACCKHWDFQGWNVGLCKLNDMITNSEELCDGIDLGEDE